MFRATLLASAVLFTASFASAQEGVLAELYGRGVHNYYAGDYIDAHRYLTMAIDNGSQDPRAYYFRGLVLDATGREEEAEEDYRTGAMLETRSHVGTLIGRSLARVQGPRRLEIEQIRQEARLEAKINQEAQARARYDERQAQESEVLRNRPTAPRTAPARPAQPAPPARPDATAANPDDLRSNPFADDGGTAAGEPTVESEDALGDPLAEAAATEEAQPAAPSAAPAPADDGGDVFGDLGGGDDSGGIFGGAMDDEAPADGGEEAPADDPFDF